MPNLTIQFPSEQSLMAFAHWMCDGGGEQDFFESTEIHCEPEHRIGRMQYHSENPQYAQNDKRRYGPFLADKTIIAHPATKED